MLGVEPRPQPILVGGIFLERGSGSWAHTPERETRIAEVEERAERYGLPPVVWPPGWPNNTLQAMRAAIWAEGRGAGAEFALAGFRRAFVEGGDLSRLDQVSEVAGAVGLPVGELAEQISRQAASRTPFGKRPLGRGSAASPGCRASRSAARSSTATIASRRRPSAWSAEPGLGRRRDRRARPAAEPAERVFEAFLCLCPFRLFRLPSWLSGFPCPVLRGGELFAIDFLLLLFVVASASASLPDLAPAAKLPAR